MKSNRRGVLARRAGGAFGALVLLLVIALPASAPAAVLHTPTAFSPIDATSIGVPSLFAANSLAVDESDDNFFVTSQRPENAVYVLGAEGGIPADISSPYKLTGFAFAFSYGSLAFDNSAASPSKGTLYVADVNNQKVERFVRNGGAEQYEIAGELTSVPALGLPTSVAVDKDGNLYVASNSAPGSPSGKVTKFSSSGVQLAQVDLSEATEGPVALAVDNAGDLFELTEGFKIFKYPVNGGGELEASNFAQVETPTFGQMNGIVVDGVSNTLLASYAEGIVEYDATSLSEKGMSPGVAESGGGMAVNQSAGLLYRGNFNKVLAFNLNGPTLADAGTVPPTEVSAIKGTLNGAVGPNGIAVGECNFEVVGIGALPCEGATPADNASHPVTAQLGGLSPHTSYRYLLAVTNANGTTRSAGKFFTTEPIAKTTAASALTADGATLNGVVRPEGSPLSACKFEYGLGADAGFPEVYEGTLPCSPEAASIPPDFEPHSVSADLSGLLVGTTYHYRLVASGGLGAENGEDLAFRTLGPSVNGKSFSVLTENSVVLEALINPNALPSSFHFEYGAQGPCAANPCVSAPVPDAAFGSGTANVKVSQPINGLTPNTTYHYRVIVSNTDGTGHSSEGTFTTYEVPSGFDPCPDEGFRAGKPSAKLPDCRVYEQASPIAKNGNDADGGSMYKVQASPSGDAITSQTYGGVPGGEGGETYPIYISKRGSSDWSTQGILPPPNYGMPVQIMGWTPDLAYSFTRVGLPGSDAVGGFDNALLLRSNASREIKELVPYRDKAEYAFVGASADDSKLFFEVQGVGLKLTANAVAGKDNLYLYEPASEEFTLVGVLPGGAAPPAGSFAGPFDWWSLTTPDALISGGAIGVIGSSIPGSGGYFTQEMHTISADGSKAFFTAGASGQIYLRDGIGGEAPETVQVSASQRSTLDPGGVKPASFLEATPSGSLAFFMSCQKLTDDSTAHSSAANACDTAEQGQDLYAYDTESGQLEDLSVDSEDSQGAEVMGLLGTSTDGSYVYFVANGDLDGPGGPAQAGDCEHMGFGFNFVGTCNLYVRHGGTTQFIAELDPSGSDDLSDAGNWLPRGVATGPALKSAHVAADGQTVVFRSQLLVTGYDNKSPSGSCVNNGNGTCPEFFRYHLGDASPSCVTCNPTGAPPAGAPSLNSFAAFVSFPGRPIGKRFVSASGDQVFFETTDKLVAADINGDDGCPKKSCRDVYEWEAAGAGSCSDASPAFSVQDQGCLYLLSTGTSPSPSFLGDASVSGEDVFIFTSDQLVPSDKDNLRDIYDVRIEGGLASQNEPPPPPPCEREACLEATNPPPTSTSAGSASFQGPGNQPPKRCPKGKVRKGSRCAKPHKRHHKRHARKQAGTKQGGSK
jgi:hypothetical protein